jgi:hypothetical protein
MSDKGIAAITDTVVIDVRAQLLQHGNGNDCQRLLMLPADLEALYEALKKHIYDEEC